MDSAAPALMYVLSSPQCPAVTLTFDLQTLSRSSVGASEYSLYVSSKLLELFMRHRGIMVRRSLRTNVAKIQSKSVMPLLTAVGW